jgi:hypothetical protein
MKTFFTACGLFCAVFYSLSVQAVSEVLITAERIEHPQVDVQQLAIKLNLKKTDTKLSINSAVKQKPEKAWMQLSLNCELPRQQLAFQCADGLLKSERLNIPFGIEFSHLYSQNKLDIDATLQFKNASFSDEAGLHAAEKLNGSLAISLKPSADAWLWGTAIDWQSGEVFWQPFYIANGGHQFTASGKLENELLTVNGAQLKVKDVG